MPFFFFDIDDGERLTIDHVGCHLADVEAARRMVADTLPEIVAHDRSGASERLFQATVRDEAGRPVLRARLSLCVETVPSDDARRASTIVHLPRARG